MKKMKSLGKNLTKNEQCQVVGGLFIDKKATCICVDESVQQPCGHNCDDAHNQCVPACANHGGVVEILGPCTDC